MSEEIKEQTIDKPEEIKEEQNISDKQPENIEERKEEIKATMKATMGSPLKLKKIVSFYKKEHTGSIE